MRLSELSVSDDPYRSGPGVSRRVSVIIPVYNSQAHLARLIESLERSNYSSIEIVVVDDASSPSIQVPSTRLRTIVLRNPSNRGKAYSVNQGVRASTGEYLVITDPDIEVSPDLFDIWVTSFEADRELGFVGAYVYYSIDRQRLTHAGAVLRKHLNVISRRCVNQIDAGLSKLSFKSKDLVLDDIYGVRKLVWQKTGGFDDVNFDTMYEDADIQLRAAQMGYGIAIIPNSRVYHHQGDISNSVLSKGWANRTMTTNKLISLCRNRLIFLRKHRSCQGLSLWVQASMLVVFYGFLVAITGKSFNQKARLAAVLIKAVKDGCTGIIR